MEKDCPYCKKTFEVQRIDSVYCSRSCRQMAYMERKMKRLKAEKLNGMEPTEEQQNTNGLLPVVALKEIPLPKPEEAYKPYDSKMLAAIRERIDNDEDMSALNTCIRIHQDIHCYWVGLRLRCLVECLLMLSEAKYAAVADLMEICNALTLMQRSIHYENLPALFPYHTFIDGLRDKLKRLCIKAQKADQIKFRLEEKDKIELMLTRYGLAQFFEKHKFNQLDFG